MQLLRRLHTSFASVVKTLISEDLWMVGLELRLQALPHFIVTFSPASPASLGIHR